MALKAVSAARLHSNCGGEKVTVLQTCAEKTGYYPLVEVKIYVALQTRQTVYESGDQLSAASQDKALILNMLAIEKQAGNDGID